MAGGPAATDGVDAVIALAVIAAAEGRHDAAEALVADARRQSPGEARLLVALAEISMQRGDWPTAVLRWERVLAAFASEIPEECWARLALAHRLQGDIGAAADVLARAGQARSDSGRLALDFERGALAMACEQWTEAAGLWRSLLADAALQLERPMRLTITSLLMTALRRLGGPLDADLRPEELVRRDHATHARAVRSRPQVAPGAARRWAAQQATSAAEGSVEVSVLVDGEGADAAALDRTLESLLAQTSPDWELLLGGSARPTRDLVSSADRRLRIPPRWAALQSPVGLWRHADGRLLLALEPGDRLAPAAVERLIEAASDTRDGRRPALVFADEDRSVIEDPPRALPGGLLLKPGWDPDLLRSQPILGTMVAFDREVIMQLGGARTLPVEPADPAHRGLLVCWDSALRILAADPGAYGVHVPEVLLQRASGASHDPVSGSSWHDEIDAAVALVGEALGAAWEVAASPWGVPLHVRPASEVASVRVSVIVPTRDRLDLLQNCVEGVLAGTDHADLELVVVDNGSVEPDTIAYLAELAEDPRVVVVSEPGPFNFSRLANRGVEAAGGEVCVLLNNDISVIGRVWLHELVTLVMRPEVGVVGCLLTHEDGAVQHGGVILGVNGSADHAFREWSADDAGYLDLLRSTRATSAVTAACLAVRREVFRSIGGFDEDGLPVELNDIDFCLRVGATGLAVLWTPHARLVHVEGATRAHDVDPARLRATEEQRAVFVDRWRHVLSSDRHYHPRLSRSGVPYLPESDDDEPRGASRSDH
jgi:O-antigen biosynthesis protein